MPTKWITDSPPDDNITVLARLDYGELPVWPCYREAGQWFSDEDRMVISDVTGWMHLVDAEKILDEETV